VFFTFDSLLNPGSISEERTQYNMFADYLMTTVNVDSSLAKKERKDLLSAASFYKEKFSLEGKGEFLVCCGHGAVSIINSKGRLEACLPCKTVCSY
jgi:hypothetical protein